MAMFISLKDARENKGLSLEELSAASGVPTKTIEKWEIDCSKATFDDFSKVLMVLNISISHVYVGKYTKAIAEIEKHLEMKKSRSCPSKVQ
jgi:predicted transcriptional regulator